MNLVSVVSRSVVIKYSQSPDSGFNAASSAWPPGLFIGVGGRPSFKYTLKSDGVYSVTQSLATRQQFQVHN